ncbi:MAG: hypothetical protein IT337_00695 [Thermomicrobiales bacterium]|nr:hypothetical protein [Thermomicrobiales bacterium]
MEPNPVPADEIRVDLLRRLAEQAMTDAEFRAVARDDLAGALERYGYDLNAHEMSLVTTFRASLADAGIDLDLARELGEDQVLRLLGM